jgi:NAD(P)-dependent dehydrogenase (short-subunit alcohol dehydrogenase family)
VRFLITGAARGIGRELLSLLQDGGHDVYAVLRPGTDVDQLGLAGHAEVDLARPDRVADAVAELADDLESLDGFVHSAGITRGGRLSEATAEDFATLFAVNVSSGAEIVKAFLPALRSAQGTVVLVNSTSGLAAGPPLSAYGSSKYALRGYADALRAEEPDIRVTSIFPSRTATEMQRELRALEGEDYVAEDYLRAGTVASVIMQALLLPADGVLTDVVLRPRPPGRR